MKREEIKKATKRRSAAFILAMAMMLQFCVLSPGVAFATDDLEALQAGNVAVEEQVEAEPAAAANEEAVIAEANDKAEAEAPVKEEAPTKSEAPAASEATVTKSKEKAAAPAAEKTSYKVTVYFDDMMKPDGSLVSKSTSNNLSAGSGWNIGQAKFNNMIANYKKCTKDGVTYTFTGEWAYEDGTPVTVPLSFKGAELTGDLDVHVHPVYAKSGNVFVDYQYIDNISTGSGSWSNKTSTFQSFSHTFKDPSVATPVAHYQFVKWHVDEDADSPFYGNGDYFAGDTYTLTKDVAQANIEVGATRQIVTYAYWQPSVTVNWHDETGAVVKSEEAFDADIEAYAYQAEDKTVTNENGESVTYTFEGWTDENGNAVAEDAAYELPGITKDPVEQKVIDLYAAYSTSKTVTIIWDDENNEDGIRPDDMVVELSADGEAAGTVVLSAENDWTYTFEDLTAFKGGEAIAYTAEQAEVPEGYEMTSEETILTAEFTNVHEIEKQAPVAPVVPTNDPAAPAANTDNTNTGNTVATSNQIAENAAPKAAPATATVADDTVIIDDINGPKAAAEGSWALINLILTAATAILSLSVLALYFTRRDKEDEETERKVKKHLIARIAGIAIAAISVIAFLLTEDMSLPMVLVDKWTLLMAVIFGADILTGILSKKDFDDEDKQEEAPAMA